MVLTHDQIVQREKKKYGNDWITFTELSYGGYRFDLFAFNPKTKEMEIVEVDVASSTEEEKIKFAQSFAKVRVYRNLGDKIIPKDFQSLINALANPIRIAMLEILIDQGSHRYSDLLHVLKFKPNDDAGKFAYHIKLLYETELIIKNNDGKYACSAKGVKLLEFFRNLE